MVRSDDGSFSSERMRAAYDAVADDYEATFGGDLARLPLDRSMLDRVQQGSDGEPILDVGCGTGFVGRHLFRGRAPVAGLDLSPGMLRVFRSRQRLPLCQGDMRHLPFGDGCFGAVVAYYSVQHVARSELPVVLREISRVLRPKGALLVATHLGDGELFIDEFLGHRIATTGGTLYGADEIEDAVASSGFSIERTEFRGPLADEYPSQRAYVLARRCR